MRGLRAPLFISCMNTNTSAPSQWQTRLAACVSNMSAGSFAIKAFLLIVPGCAVLIDGMSAHDIARIALIAVSGICALSFAAGVAANRGNGGGSKTLALCAIALLVLALIAVRHAPDPVAAAREFAVIVGLASVAPDRPSPSSATRRYPSKSMNGTKINQLLGRNERLFLTAAA